MYTDYCFRKDWIYLELGKWLYIFLDNPIKTMWKARKVFKLPKLHFRCGKYWYPVLWCSKPNYIHIRTCDVGWKDKWDTPRFESVPHIWIYLFGLNLVWYWEWSKDYDGEHYWEQVLWYLHYYDTYSQGLLDSPDINRARESWPWRGSDDKSTWNGDFERTN